MTEPIPSKVLELAGGTQPQLVWTNERGGTTYQAGARFIKWNPHTTRLDLEGERRRLEWAARYHNVPRVLDWGTNDEAQWLVTAALAGTGRDGTLDLTTPRRRASYRTWTAIASRLTAGR